MKKNTFNPTKKVLIIAEAGNNHEGSFNVAKKLVIKAAKAGVDAIKFQTFKTENFINKENIQRYSRLKKFELSYKNFIELKKLANKNNLLFISTPFDLTSAKFLSKNSDIIKIASSDNNFYYLIKEVLKSNKKIIISTGLADEKQIKKTVRYIIKTIGFQNFKKRISLLHCVTSYPVSYENANLNSITYLKNEYKCTIGYSDHTIGPEASLAAVSLGAKIIEKHFTLSKTFSDFRDHALSADQKELSYIVNGIRKIEKMLGNINKKIQYKERQNSVIRRSIFAKIDLRKNSKITIDKLNFLRSDSFNSFLDVEAILGKLSKRDIKKNSKIKLKDIKKRF